MSVHEKIRLVRQAKGLTQEEVAEKLKMSVNGYGDIERGETDVNLSRLEQLADLFEMTLTQLFGIDGKNVFNSNNGTQHSQNNNCTIHSCPSDYVQLKIDFEKQTVQIQQKDKEIQLLTEKIADLNRIIKLLETHSQNA
jgi:transcriptional regulator with XRE-family HTH domain